MPQRPNFLVIVTDQHCADWLSAAGHPVVRTPHIDQLAAAGTHFKEFHTAAPVCMPNRASLLTGRYPSVHGLRHNGCALSYDARTFVEVLRNHGYRTATIGKNHLQPFTGIPTKPVLDAKGQPRLDAWKTGFQGLDLENDRHYEGVEHFDFPTPYYGFDHVDMVTGHGDTTGGHYLQWLKTQTSDWAQYRQENDQFPHAYSCPQAKRTRIPEALYSTRYIENQTCAWIREHATQAKPFFLFVSFPDPHHPFNPPGRYWDLYQPEQFDLPNPFSRFINAPPPLTFAHQRLTLGGSTGSPQEAFAATIRHCQEAMALTAGMLTMIDDAVGHIMQTLQTSGVDEETVVLFTADHGDYLGDGQLLLKGPWMRQSIHQVPMIWRDPQTALPHHTQVLGSTIDIAPTILARANLPAFDGIQGRDLIPDVQSTVGRDSLLIEFNDNLPRLGLRFPARSRTLYSQDWRMTLYAGEGWGELYHTPNDPAHCLNLWNAPEHQAVKSALLEQLAIAVTQAMDESPRALQRA